jgi:hypothetical protein
MGRFSMSQPPTLHRGRFGRLLLRTFLLGTGILLSSGGSSALSDETAPELALAPTCDEDAHRDGAHEPIDFETIQECMGTNSDSESWSRCHHADFNCDGVIGIPDFNLFRSSLARDEGAA